MNQIMLGFYILISSIILAYVLTEQCYLTSQSKILRVFSTYPAALKAAREGVKTNKNNDYSFKVIGYVVEDIA